MIIDLPGPAGNNPPDYDMPPLDPITTPGGNDSGGDPLPTNPGGSGSTGGYDTWGDIFGPPSGGDYTGGNTGSDSGFTGTEPGGSGNPGNPPYVPPGTPSGGS